MARRVQSSSGGFLMGTLKRFSVILAILGIVLLTASDSFAITKTKRKATTPTRTVTRSEAQEAEARLKEMGYPAGKVDGVVDGTTRSGLILFQKWEGRKITGRLTRDDLEAIMTATAPAPKDTGYKHVEVDVDRQVLLLVDDEGAITRMLPVSTGSNKHYKEKRMSGLAYTPRGRFRIYSKLSGWRKSPLGLLYYPNYFSDGLAIHGNPEVPHTPQSHGCIRIPMSEAESISRALPIGTIVLIYDSQGWVSAKDWAEADKQKKQEAVR